MKRRRSNTLVALSSAAVMTVYAAGFMRTRAAAERLEHSSRERPPALPAPAPVAAATLAPIATPLAVAAPPAVEVPAPAAPKATPAPRQKPASEPATTEQHTAVAVQSSAPEKIEEPAPQKVDPAMPAAATTDHAPAPAAPSAAPLSPSAEVLLGGTELHNGTFLGWGSSRHGDIQASVTIYSGRITAVSIAQCRTRYSCDVIAHLPSKVLNDQTPEKINNVSGATQSVDAFYWAVMDAISKAK